MKKNNLVVNYIHLLSLKQFWYSWNYPVKYLIKIIIALLPTVLTKHNSVYLILTLFYFILFYFFSELVKLQPYTDMICIYNILYISKICDILVWYCMC